MPGIAFGYDSKWSGKVRNREGTDEVLDEGELQVVGLLNPLVVVRPYLGK